MRFRVKDIESYLAGKISWRTIAGLLNTASFETTLNGDTIEVEVLPNRFADAASLLGLAREIAAVSKVKVVPPTVKLHEGRELVERFIRVRVATPRCRQYFGRVLTGVRNGPSPKWLRDFVTAYGFHSINLLVDLSNFVMIEYGAPLHIIDLDTLGTMPLTLTIRETKGGETFHALNGNNYTLPKGAVVIPYPNTKNTQPEIIDLVAIQGGKAIAVTEATTNILIQAPVLEPAAVYAVGRAINLHTEAAHRAERRVAPINAERAVERLAALIQEHAGGTIARGRLTAGKLPAPIRLTLTLERLAAYAGQPISVSMAESILRRLGCRILRRTAKFIAVEAPPERLDLMIEEDLIEEIIRLHTEQIPERLPQAQRVAHEDAAFALSDLVAGVATQAGFDEAVTYNFVSDEDVTNFRELLPLGREFVRVLNPMSDRFTTFRPLLLINLAKAVAANLGYTREIRLFELGRRATIGERKQINEERVLAFAISLPNAETALLEARGFVGVLAEALGVALHVAPAELAPFELSATIHTEGDTAVGFLGLFNRERSRRYDLDQRLVVGEIALDPLRVDLEAQIAYRPLPAFPAIVRDLSLVVPETLRLDHLEQELQHQGGEFLEDIALFDVFSLEGDGERKSVSFRLTFRAADRSLRDEEVNGVMQQLAHALVNRFGLTLR